MYDPAQLKKDAETIRKSGYFDADWYRAAYKDVDQVGMDPAEHYLRFGAMMRRDPGPNFSTTFYAETRNGVAASGVNELIHAIENEGKPDAEVEFKRVLKAASLVALSGQHERAIYLAKKHLPAEWQFSTHLLEANAAITMNDESNWLTHINAYLAYYKCSPISLNDSGGTLFSRLTSSELHQIDSGPLVSVLMPAWNAEKTIRVAVNSLLQQTWHPLEIIVVDDCSEDGTWDILKELAEADNRVKILRNGTNAGAYVSKNRALQVSTGQYITGHDADDWAHPERIEKQLEYILSREGYVKAALSRMIRMRPSGYVTNIKNMSQERLDGALQLAYISCMFEGEFLRSQLGYWDCVRFSGDSEMIARAEFLLGDRMKHLDQLSMLCLDIESSLTNHPTFGISKTGSIGGPRLAYRENFRAWHKANLRKKDPSSSYVEFPPTAYRFNVPEIAQVSQEQLLKALATST